MAEPSGYAPLADRVALVFGAGCVGAGWGNGKAAAVAYARAGATVVAVDVMEGRAEATRDLILGEGGRSVALAADVSRHDQVKGVVDRTEREFGQIDILHNNVGIALFGGPVDLTEEDWDRSIDCNLKGAFLTCKHVIPIMERQGRGVITNISSILSKRVSAYPLLAYCASKAGLDHFTRVIALMYATKGIRANAILPGLIDTPQIHGHGVISNVHGGDDEQTRARNAISPTGKQGEAWDIAHTAVFLATDEAKYINGVLLQVDGGLLARQG